MVNVVSRHLLALEAAWDDGPQAGTWIADRLGPFGPSVGHAVPIGYPAYAIVPIQWDDEDQEAAAPAVTLDGLLDVLELLTGDQPVHAGIWPGFGWMYETGSDPRENAGVSVYWSSDGPGPRHEEIDRVRVEAVEQVAAERVEMPDTRPLTLPWREYYLWTGPLRSALAFRHQAPSLPSLIWPEDRSWFLGAPIYTNEIAVAGPPALIDAVIDDARLAARAASINEDLDIDD